jgi:hypothetical protein
MVWRKVDVLDPLMSWIPCELQSNLGEKDVHREIADEAGVIAVTSPQDQASHSNTKG